MPGRQSDYDPVPVQEFLRRLLDKSGESYRAASSAAGLHPTTVSNYMRGMRPMRDACIALADHFDINPNEMLEAAGYEPLHFFDRRLVDPNALPPDVERLVGEIMLLEDATVRQEMVDTLRQALRVLMRIKDIAIPGQ
ncbi:MAG: helix-turn-helix transcriptional regulator [Proteobacteria bacterium]|nr:helix-turn-helix transcriptional regulator [Pseudomonadota bacterium]